MITLLAIHPTYQNLLLFFSGFFVVGIFIFNRQLLIRKVPFISILVITIVIALYSLIMDLNFKSSLMFDFWPLRIPLFSLIIFRIYRYLFKRKYKREPQDTFWNYKESTPVADRLFNIAYGCTCFIIPVFLGVLGRF